MNPSRKKSLPFAARAVLWALPVLFVLLIAGFLVFHAWFNAYLESPAFRQLIGGLTSARLKASGEYQPFHFSGSTIYSDEFKAQGTAETFFSGLDAQQIRAEINLHALWDHAWEIDDITIQRVDASLGHGPASATADATDTVVAVAGPAPAPSNPLFNWLPKRVDLRKITMRDTNLKWGENTARAGSLSGGAFTLIPDGAAWNITGEGGSISQNGGPRLTIDDAQMRYQSPSLYITEARLRNADGGTIEMSGEVSFKDRFDIQAKMAGIPITPFLREDWRAKLGGNLSGTMQIHAPMPLRTVPDAEGSLSLAQGTLEALPVLDQIALFTRTQGFRKISLSKASANFTQAAGRTTVTNFVAESQGLICVEGNFVVENSNIDGTFQVGVTPASLQWLPGSQSKVFTVSRNGYVWTQMRLTGPIDNPKEDLTPRLVAAASGAVIDTIQSTIQDLPKGTIPEAPKNLIDNLLSPLLK